MTERRCRHRSSVKVPGPLAPCFANDAMLPVPDASYWTTYRSYPAEESSLAHESIHLGPGRRRPCRIRRARQVTSSPGEANCYGVQWIPGSRRNSVTAPRMQPPSPLRHPSCSTPPKARRTGRPTLRAGRRAGHSFRPIPLALSAAFVTRSGERGSNPRPSAWEADALPTELSPRSHAILPSGARFAALGIYNVTKPWGPAPS